MLRKLTFLIAIVAFSLTACAGQADQPAQSLTLRARDIAFDATTLEVKANQPVSLTYVNEGLIDHAFKIEGLLDEQKVKPGEAHTFTFTPIQAGQFKFVCAMPGHEMAGMVGTLTVTQ
ncbi:MAG: cupredoxin domain-containing protein [Anaerolineales bacterium]